MLSIAIIGRPNVGKSTLFNRLVGKKLALVHDLPGVTRDRKMAKAKFKDIDLEVIDTAGYEYSTEDNMESRMWKQTQMAINDADVCLFLFDGHIIAVENALNHQQCIALLMLKQHLGTRVLLI